MRDRLLRCAGLLVLAGVSVAAPGTRAEVTTTATAGAAQSMAYQAAARDSAGPALESPSEPRPVTLDAAEQTRLGVAVSKLSAVPAPAGMASLARVLDPAPLLALDNELASALASLQASRAEAQRTRKLFAEDRTASEHAVQAAQSQARADQLRVESARRRLALEWGEGVAALAPRNRAALMDDLAGLRAELVRIELPPALPSPRKDSRVAVGVNPGSMSDAVVLGGLPSADPRLQTRGVLAKLSGQGSKLAIGQMLTARFPSPDAHATGVRLPRSALIRKDSKIWAYVQTRPATFLRREVSGYVPMADGWFVRGGFSPGEQVVTAGAAALFAIEAPAPAAAD